MKKISLLIVTMLLLASCGVSAPTDEKTTDVTTDWTKVNVTTDWVSVETTDDGTKVEVETEETPAPTEEEATPATDDTSADSNTSVKIGADFVDVDAGWVDVKIN